MHTTKKSIEELYSRL